MKQRVVVSLIVGVELGMVVASLVGIPRLTGPASIAALISNAFTFWGLVMGAFAGAVGMGLVFAILNRRDRNTSRWGRRLAGATPGTVRCGDHFMDRDVGVLAVLSRSLWIYPLAIMTTIASVILLRPRRPGAWDEPPGA